jgi:TPR repeat protein
MTQSELGSEAYFALKPDFATAFHWLSMASQKGDLASTSRLAALYMQGHRVNSSSIGAKDFSINPMISSFWKRR